MRKPQHRLLVACPKCRRQFDVSKYDFGQRFHCLCGEKLTVQQPKGHDASVVRCSSCGAPRVKRAVACGHCGSDFTLHERDLHTVCPGCLARVSNKASYCHHCATPLLGQTVGNETVDRHCPACRSQRKLVSRRFSDYPVAILECDLCAGIWIGLAELNEVLEAESRGKYRPIANTKSVLEAAHRRNYIKCIDCGELMTRRNLGKGKSGVVVDVCGQHGVWFDADELARVIAWTRAGGLEDLRRDLARLSGSKDTARKKVALAADQTRRTSKTPARTLSNDPSFQPSVHWLPMAAEIAAQAILNGMLRSR